MEHAQIIEQLKLVYDPELGVNVVDLGLIYQINLEDNGAIHIQMTLTTPGCPMHDTIAGGVERAIKHLPDVHAVRVEVVWSPPWSPENMSASAKEQLGYM